MGVQSCVHLKARQRHNHCMSDLNFVVTPMGERAISQAVITIGHARPSGQSLLCANRAGRIPRIGPRYVLLCQGEKVAHSLRPQTAQNTPATEARAPLPPPQPSRRGGSGRPSVCAAPATTALHAKKENTNDVINPTRAPASKTDKRQPVPNLFLVQLTAQGIVRHRHRQVSIVQTIRRHVRQQKKTARCITGKTPTRPKWPPKSKSRPRNCPNHGPTVQPAGPASHDWERRAHPLHIPSQLQSYIRLKRIDETATFCEHKRSSTAQPRMKQSTPQTPPPHTSTRAGANCHIDERAATAVRREPRPRACPNPVVTSATTKHRQQATN